MNHETNELQLIIDNTESYYLNVETIKAKYTGILREVQLQNFFNHVKSIESMPGFDKRKIRVNELVKEYL